MKTELNRNTLFTFFSGHATPLQKKLVEEWLNDDAHKEQYYEWLEAWEREHPQFIVDTPLALEQFIGKMNDQDGPTILIQDHDLPTRSVFRWTAYAAAIAMLMVFGVYMSRDFIEFKHYTTGYGEVLDLKLDDGSRVSLNANSSLKVHRFGFGSKTREVFLEGEAEFSVVHTKDDAKFLVNTPDKLQVEVLGTEFIVYSRARGSKVVLTRGKVLLHALRDTVPTTLSIKPGDVVTIHKGVFSLKEKQPVNDHAAWKEHRFVFDHTSLEEIAYQVEESFGLRMQISDTLLAKRELTGTYEANSAEDLLDVLSRVLDVEVKQNGKRISIHSRD